VLGNWTKNGQPLVNDAQYEFNAVGRPTPYPILKNSLSLPLGDGKFHSDHIYESTVFTATKDEMNFFIYDTNYSDNKGSLAVEIAQVNAPSNAINIWKGEVSSDGGPSPAIQLTQGKTYQIVVTGQMSLGTWSKNGKQLANDACFEFAAAGTPIHIPCFQNTLNINVCDDKFHSNHVYQSQPFAAEKDSISFWIFDTDYSDNSGNLQVQLNQIK